MICNLCKGTGNSYIGLNVVEKCVLCEGSGLISVNTVYIAPKLKISEELKLLQRIAADLTIKEISDKIGKSMTWVVDMLSLGKLNSEFMPLVDDGTIPLSNAFLLARLQPIAQYSFIEKAKTMKSSIFYWAVDTHRRLHDRNRNKAAR